MWLIARFPKRETKGGQAGGQTLNELIPGFVSTPPFLSRTYEFASGEDAYIRGMKALNVNSVSSLGVAFFLRWDKRPTLSL